MGNFKKTNAFFRSTPYASMKLFRMNGVYVIAFGKLKMVNRAGFC